MPRKDMVIESISVRDIKPPRRGDAMAVCHVPRSSECLWTAHEVAR